MWRLLLVETMRRAWACSGSSPDSICEFFLASCSGMRLEVTPPSATKSPVAWSSLMRSALVAPVASDMRAAPSSSITLWSESSVALAARAWRSPAA